MYWSRGILDRQDGREASDPLEAIVQNHPARLDPAMGGEWPGANPENPVGVAGKPPQMRAEQRGAIQALALERQPRQRRSKDHGLPDDLEYVLSTLNR